MRHRLLGHSGLRVSELFLGAMTFADGFVHGAGRDRERRSQPVRLPYLSGGGLAAVARCGGSATAVTGVAGLSIGGQKAGCRPRKLRCIRGVAAHTEHMAARGLSTTTPEHPGAVSLRER